MPNQNKGLIIKSLLQGKCKVSWNTELASKYRLMEAFQQGKLNPNSMTFKLVSITEYQTISQDRTTARKSSTKYEL